MILITGGAGYIGSHTVKLLQKENKEILVVDNLSTGNIQSINCPFEQIDLQNKNEIDSIFKKYKIESVIHFAANAYVGESVTNPRKYYTNNTIGTLNLLHSMLDNNVNNIIFSSTCATYGHPIYTPINEEHSQLPINPYGKSKLVIENVLKDYNKSYKLNYIALRYFNAAGASMDGLIGESHNPETHIVPLILKNIKNETTLNVFGNNYKTKDGTCIRDYIHVDDLAKAHYLALQKIHEFCGFINLGTYTGLSVLELIKVCEEVTNKKCKYVFKEKREGDPTILIASNEKAKQVLNWSPAYNIKDIIQSAWQWEQNKKY